MLAGRVKSEVGVAAIALLGGALLALLDLLLLYLPFGRKESRNARAGLRRRYQEPRSRTRTA